jgi:ribosomal protein S12 methylthiotransferase
VREHRADIIMDQQLTVMDDINSSQIGKDIEVVVEGFDRYAECYFGRSYADAPEIDGKIFFDSNNKLNTGQFVTVHIDDVLDYDLIGAVADESAE